MTLLLVCENPDTIPHRAELLARVSRYSPGTAQTPLHACDWQHARSTLDALRQRSGPPTWVVLQTRYPQPWQWRFLREALQPLGGAASHAVFWTASQRRAEALGSVTLGGAGFLPLGATEPGLAPLWCALQERLCLLPRRLPHVPLACRRRTDHTRRDPKNFDQKK